MIVLQHIVTIWTKRTRGAEGRERRARLPSHYPVPDPPSAASGRCLHQHVRRDEWHDWSAQASVEVSDRLRATDAVTFAEGSGVLEVTLRGDACGRPRRDGGKVSVPFGGRLTVRFNGRRQAFDDPWYEDHILHVAYEARIATAMFADEQLVLDRRVDLW